MILIKGATTDFNSFLQWYIGEKGLNVKTGHKVFRILFTYFLREFETISKLSCLQNNIFPKFLNFRVSNSYLKSSRAYHACQIKLLKEEISYQSRIRTLEKDFKNRKEKLRETLGIIDYTPVIYFFLTQNDRKLAHHQNIHSKKLFNLDLEFHMTPVR